MICTNEEVWKNSWINTFLLQKENIFVFLKSDKRLNKPLITVVMIVQSISRLYISISNWSKSVIDMNHRQTVRRKSYHTHVCTCMLHVEYNKIMILA